MTEKQNTIPFKYKEEELIEEFYKYIKSTYSKHYVGDDNVQAMDLIIATGRGEGFCVGNILKYASRLGKKDNQEREDILKILHYTLLLMFIYKKKEGK